MLRYVALIWFLWSASTNGLLAASIRHTLLESDSPTSFQTQRACYGLYYTKKQLYCAPFPHLEEEKPSITVDFLVDANEKGASTLYRISEKDINRDLLDSLFTSQSFEKSSGIARIIATYFNTSLSLTPIHFTGGYKISNPSLPDLKLSGLQQNVLRISHNVFFANAFKHWDASLSASLFYFKREFYEGDFDVLTAIGRKTNELIIKSKDSHMDADIAGFLYSQRPWLPSIGFRLNNAFNRYDCELCRNRSIDVEHNVGTKLSLHLSSFINHTYGKSLLASQLLYEGFQLAPNTDLMSIAYIYKLAKLSSYASFSSLMYSFGFAFHADLYQVGIQYTNEKQSNEISIERRKQTYVYASLVL